MAKKESTFFNMAFTLFIVTLASSTALGYVYEVTKGPKAAADLAKKTRAIEAVTPEFTNNPLEEKKEIQVDGGTLIFYTAKKDGKVVATAVETFTNSGFGGAIKLMVGFLPDGTIYNVAVVEHKETPGLGDKIESSKSPFSIQYKGKNPGKENISLKKDGGSIDGITAATISSRAFVDAVQRAYDNYKEAQN